ncbi:PelD GGDEF domain-containing protein [Azonexus sp.]|uniref:PelD GGDEF domain-containing protein n=1 Tax=Azonexus sp. TaxID=1872668 RepID=UPI0027B8F303|nr:PelD GGDEF domain-containing protein [Azonexus sp.]
MNQGSLLRDRLDISKQSDPTSSPGAMLGRLSTPETRPATIIGEILILPLVVIALGFLLSPDDPLWMHSGFPWAWFAPTILALRYGPLAGLGGAAVILLAWLSINFGHYDTFPKLGFLGGLILVMLVGEFSSIWEGRTRRAEIEQRYHEQRMEHLTRSYYLLRLSHDRLEQDLISRPMSMRDALQALRDHHAPGSPEGTLALLRLLAQYCQLESAALYPVEDEKLITTPQARIGQIDHIAAKDPLVLQALETLRLCHVSSGDNDTHPTRYLIAAPLLDLSGQIYGLLLVEKMPFFSLHEEALQTINLLLSYYTDGLVAEALARPLLEKYPDSPTHFAFEIRRLLHLHQSTGIASIVVALEFLPRAIASDMPQQIDRMKRSLDENWLLVGKEKQILATLMPLGESSTAEGYIARLENWANQKAGESLAAVGIFPHIIPLTNTSAENLMQRLQDLSNG